jgi:DNA-binding XRE family transcriptional regulator
MVKYEDLKAKLLSDPDVKKEYDSMRFEYKIAETLIEARVKAKMTQADVARKMNTTQSAVARLESGNAFPSLQTIHKYASAINRSIDLHVIP